MSWITRLFTRRRPQVSRGLFIPGAAPLPAPMPERSLMLRPVTAIAVVSTLCFIVYSQASQYVDARLTQPASPVVMFVDNEPYQTTALAVGPNRDLTDPSFYANLKDELVQQADALIAIDSDAATLSVYREGEEVLVARYRARAATDSWRHIPAGYYEVERVRNERYSSLEQAYYQHVVQLNQRMAIHGPARKNDGTSVAAASLGVTVSAADAASLATLVRRGTPVLVHVPDNNAASQNLTPRGPDLPVRSYMAYDLATDQPLVAHQPDQAVAIASLTKLMTALIVTEQFDLEGEIEVDQERYVTTLVSRLPGTAQTSVYDLLQLLLLESSNEAAEVIATHLGRDTFIAAMNERAAALGLRNTTFTDPSGLDNGNRSTAADLTTLVQYLYEHHPYLLRISSVQNAVDAARTNDFSDLKNFNRIDGLDTFIGGKSGETSAARQTSVTIHELPFRHGIRPVALIVLGSEDRDEDVTSLHDYLLQQYAE